MSNLLCLAMALTIGLLACLLTGIILSEEKSDSLGTIVKMVSEGCSDVQPSPPLPEIVKCDCIVHQEMHPVSLFCKTLHC